MGGRIERFLARFRLAIAAVLGAILVLFALQNLAEVRLTILLWSVQAHLFAVIGIGFAIGLAVGWLLHAHRRGRGGR